MNDVEKIIKELASKKKADREEAMRKEKADKLLANRARYALCMQAFGPLLDVAGQSNMLAYPLLHPIIEENFGVGGVSLNVRFQSARANPGVTHYEFYPDKNNPGELIVYRASGGRISETFERLSTADAIAKFLDRLSNAISLEY